MNRVIALLILFFIGIGVSSFVFLRNELAPGWDSYFYILQAKSWIENGELHSSRYNIIYPILILFSWLFNNQELAYKITTIIAFSAFTPLLFLLLLNWTNRFNNSLIFAFIALINPQLIYFASQFTKNLIALDFFLVLLLFLTKKKYILSFITLVIIAFSHKLILVISVIYIIIHYGLPYLEKNRIALYAFLSLTIAFIGVLLWTKPMSFITNEPNIFLFSFFRSHSEVVNLSWKIFLLISFGILILCIVRFNSLKAQFKELLVLFLILNFPFIEWDNLGISFRLFMICGVLLPILFASTPIETSSKWRNTLIPLFTIGLMLPLNAYSKDKHDPDYLTYQFIAAKLKNHHHTKLLIAHKGLAEYISFKNDIDVLPWNVIENKVNYSNRLVNLPSTMAKYISQTITHQKITSDYILVKESLWRANILPRLTMEEKKTLLNWKNPNEIRPGYLLKQ